MLLGGCFPHKGPKHAPSIYIALILQARVGTSSTLYMVESMV